MAYYRKPDGAWVIRDLTTGKKRAVPGRFLREGSFCRLSPAARFLVICGRSYQIVDTYTGRAHTLPPGHYQRLSFSPDNAYVLYHRKTDPDPLSHNPGITEVFSTKTWTVVRHGTRIGALRMGGSVIAYVDARLNKPTYIRLHDLATGRSAGSAIKVPTGEVPKALVWDRANHLDVLTYVPRKYRGGVVVRQESYRWRRANAGMRVLDTFRIPATRWKLVQGGLP